MAFLHRVLRNKVLLNRIFSQILVMCNKYIVEVFIAQNPKLKTETLENDWNLYILIPLSAAKTVL